MTFTIRRFLILNSVLLPDIGAELAKFMNVTQLATEATNNTWRRLLRGGGCQGPEINLHWPAKLI